MPLRCIDEHQKSIQAFDITPEDWQSLTERNRTERHLKAACCVSPVVLKQSKVGTRFFAHTTKGGCKVATDTEVHLRLKQIAVEAARAQGWEAETEVSGQTPSGDPWTADVLATKGDGKLAIEIQWSSQTAEETLLRQDRYRAAGVRSVWLLKRSGTSVNPKLPCAEIVGDGVHNFTAKLSSGQTLPVASFLEAAFAGRLRFDVPQGASGTVSVKVAPTKCWHPECRADSTVFMGVDVAFGPHCRAFRLGAFSGHPELLQAVLKNVPGDLPLGAIKPRYSKTMEAEYLSNGCIRCDRLFGQHFEHELWYDEDTVASCPIQAVGPWFDLFKGRDCASLGWGVYRADELTA